MSLHLLDGRAYARMLLGGAALLREERDRINDLNVFPVADGDTGTNMSRTMEGGLSAISPDEDSIGRTSEEFSRGVLLSARGNSGVILSQIFAGISEGLSGYDAVTPVQLAQAYKRGIEKSYASVREPVEGTILTVFRESTDLAADMLDENSTVEDFFRIHTGEARRSLASTKELLPALAEADVIDSGGAGYLCIAEGMYSVLTGKEVVAFAPADEGKQTLDLDSFTRDSTLEYGYCTEFLLRLTTQKTDPDAFDTDLLISRLEREGGESIVAYRQGDAVKVHVHTFTPHKALAAGLEYGEFLTVKVENMSLAHTEERKLPKKEKPLSVVAVVSGKELTEIFKSLGADVTVCGGQTLNPSVEEFTEAFRQCGSREILVLPNNKNVILAARRAAEIYTDARVIVVDTHNLMEGYAALSVITPGMTDADALSRDALRAAKSVICCEVTRAVRNATVDGVEVKKDEYMALSQGSVKAVSSSPEGAIKGFLANSDLDMCEIVTLFTGESVPPQTAEGLASEIEGEYPDLKVEIKRGGHGIYDYMVAAE